jgi:hypothetical protein
MTKKRIIKCPLPKEERDKHRKEMNQEIAEILLKARQQKSKDKKLLSRFKINTLAIIKILKSILLYFWKWLIIPIILLWVKKKYF